MNVPCWDPCSWTAPGSGHGSGHGLGHGLGHGSSTSLALALLARGLRAPRQGEVAARVESCVVEVVVAVSWRCGDCVSLWEGEAEDEVLILSRILLLESEACACRRRRRRREIFLGQGRVRMEARAFWRPAVAFVQVLFASVAFEEVGEEVGRA